MLVLTRRTDQGITLQMGHDTLHILLIESHAGVARLGIDAPAACTIVRDELLWTERLNRQAASSALPSLAETMDGPTPRAADLTPKAEEVSSSIR